MKKILFLILFIPGFLFAQINQKKNALKTNLCGLAINNYNLTYERSLSKRFSISFGYRNMPKANLPYLKELQKQINQKDVDLNIFKLGNVAATTELRLYLGKKRMKGFYFAPYGRYANFNLTFPIEYPDSANNKGISPIQMEGKITSYSAGLMMGVQFNLSKRMVFDFWILGGHYGKSSGTLTASNISPELTPEDQTSLQNSLNDLKNLGPFSFEGKVTSSTSAELKTTGPWLGLRSLGLSIGFRF